MVQSYYHHCSVASNPRTDNLCFQSYQTTFPVYKTLLFKLLLSCPHKNKHTFLVFRIRKVIKPRYYMQKRICIFTEQEKHSQFKNLTSWICNNLNSTEESHQSWKVTQIWHNWENQSALFFQNLCNSPIWGVQALQKTEISSLKSVFHIYSFTLSYTRDCY